MMKFLAAAGLLACAALPALAQSGADGMDPNRPVATDTGSGAMTDISAQTWAPAVREVFFADEAMTSLRPTDEMADRWAELDPESKAQAKRDCQAYLMDAGSMGGASSGGLGGAVTPDPDVATNEEPAAPDNPAPVASDTTNSSNAPASPGDASVWTQACSFVTSFQSQ
ncbi:hypothetical protein LAZ40_20675 [Cereibacter sphaeroides]|uniref:hypothetical protein n=1 Tax=Rhodobacterales TaxID=204455 RepID=UPI000BBE43D0|nr:MULTISPECIES: hypothetical protein [Paracoccaceae]MCE6961447.1 hypothetical protein [Cereibacter sphaeroides]MCE6970434.1 hypothetical protein [Cereibacter sphaeroides]MCE6973872.1 hypothetical protein [Cereibacter sphaeroides]